jgi:hypothetical protein
MIFRPGTAVWVEHPDLAWAEAEVVSSPASPSSPSYVTVVLSTGVKVRAQRLRQPIVSISKLRCVRCSLGVRRTANFVAGLVCPFGYLCVWAVVWPVGRL